jgi:hypothetical protein
MDTSMRLSPDLGQLRVEMTRELYGDRFSISVLLADEPAATLPQVEERALRQAADGLLKLADKVSRRSAAG